MIFQIAKISYLQTVFKFLSVSASNRFGQE